MTFFQDMAALAVELLGPDSDFGEQLVINRPAGAYNAATRQTTAAPPMTQSPWGTIDPAALSAVSAPGSLTATYERVMLAVPLATGGFEPGQGDQVVAGGRTYAIDKTAHIIKAGIPILWMAGLATT